MCRFILRLGKCDLDLIALSEDKDFKGAVKTALLSFVSGKRFVYPMPQTLPRTEKTNTRISLAFNKEDKKESAVIDFLKSINSGCRNAVVLSIIRSSLPFPVISPFLEDDGVFYDIFVKKKQRGRKKGAVSALSEKEPVRVKPLPKEPEQAPVALPQAKEITAVEDFTANEEQQAVDTSPSPAPAPLPSVPVRPSLIEMVEQERAIDTKQEEEIPEAESDGFDPFSLASDMMKSF